MPLLQKLCHFGSCRVETGKDGEYRFLTFQYLLVKHIVGLEELHQSRSSKYNHYGVHLVEAVLAIVYRCCKMFGSACGENVYRICHRRSGIEFRLQLLGCLSSELRHLQTSLRQCVGEHHSWASSMGNDSET